MDVVLPTGPRAPGPVPADPARRATAIDVATGAGDRSAPVRTDDLSLSSAHESLAPS
ncbi:hypothetical protein [Geodermatophilus pulveris]|uniref:hypothetical protein n=1 Tax=Geodermatophilus pulveris TaxID=1564159 RepID=UPI0015C636B9|nr:hypothetical protein [Geodermatophilus pulveris]